MSADPYASRESYRVRHSASDLGFFRVTVDETDLSIGCRGPLRREALDAVVEARGLVLAEIADRPRFKTSLEPLRPHGTEPELISRMLSAGEIAGVGPMAAVAGAIAEYVGRALSAKSPEVIVENGGDVFLLGDKPRSVAVVAPGSPLSGLLAVSFLPVGGMGVCTSSGTVGHSLSLGKADAALVIARDCALADAAATRLGNLVQGPEDLENALDLICALPGVEGALVIVGEKLGVKGKVEIKPVTGGTI